MTLFKCRVCAEKDKRIADLQKNINFLQQQLSPPTSADRIPIVHLEADGVLSAQQHVIEVPDFATRAAEAELDAVQAEIAERDRLFSASY